MSIHATKARLFGRKSISSRLSCERLQPPNLHSKTLANRMPYRTHSGMVIRCFKGLEPSCSNYIVKKESSRHRFEIVLLNKGVFFLRSFGLRFTRCSFLFSSNTVPPHLKPFTRLACQVFHQWVNQCLRYWTAMSRQSPSHLKFSSATLLPTVFRRNGIFLGDCGFFGRVGLVF